MAVSYNPAQQAAANAGASAAAIKKVATPKKKTPVVSNAAQAAAVAAGASPSVVSGLVAPVVPNIAQNVAQAAAISAGASPAALQNIVAPPPAPVIAQNVAQAAAISAGASPTALENIIAPAAPNVATPRVPNPVSPVNTALEDDLNLVFQRGYPSSTAPTSQPTLPQQDLTQRGYPSSTEGYTYREPFNSLNPAQLAAMNAGASQEVIDRLAGASPEQIKSLEGNSLGLQSLIDFHMGQQPTQTTAPSGAGTSYSGSASTSNYMPNVTLPTAPGTTTTGMTGEGAATSGTPGSVVAPTAPADMTNAYLEQLNNMTFDYDPSTDKDYLRAVAQTENAIIQSMIGRGGLYSSVAQSAVAVKLADLAIDYENIAYDKYVDQRNFMFERAQFEQSRLNTIWEQNFQLAQFDATLQQRKFENEMAIAEFNFALEKEAYNRKRQAAADARAAASYALAKQQAILKQQQQEQQNAIANALYANNIDQQKYSEMVSRWEQSGKADADVAEYFSAYGVYEGASLSNSAMLNAVRQKENYISDEAYKISEYAVQYGEAAIAAEYISTFNQPAEVVIRGTTEANSDVTMLRNYNSLLNDATSAGTTEGYTEAINKLTDINNYGVAVDALGEYYYGKLLNELQQAKTKQSPFGF